MSLILDGLVAMNRQILAASLARLQAEESSRNFKTDENRSNELSSITEINSQITNIKSRIRILNQAEATTRTYKEDFIIGKIDPNPERVLWLISNLKIAYGDLLKQQEDKLK